MSTAPTILATTDVAIAGAGIIGLSLGLELRRRGLSVVVLDRHQAMSSASAAAGGMLAVHDPQNPPGLLPLALRSRELYPEYLAHIESLSGLHVPLRTHHTLQHRIPGGAPAPPATAAQITEFAPGLNPSGHSFDWLDESSLDPRDLCTALPAAFLAAGGTLLEQTELLEIHPTSSSVILRTPHQPIAAAHFVDCRGAWSGISPRISPEGSPGVAAGSPALPGAQVFPVKGQMANLYCPPGRLRCVVRAPGIYLIPRGDSRVTIGATLEHAGFDQHIEPAAIHRLILAARQLLPEAEPPTPPQSWAGLRPGTPDGLPILGPMQYPAPHPNCWHATGHYRDGILLAPATARLIAQAILNQPLDLSLEPFSPARF